MTCTGTSEIQQLLNMGLTGVAAGAKDMDHLDGAAAAVNYIRIADMVAHYCESGAVQPPILDWGCGYGQVSWLLRRRQVPVVSCDVQERNARGAIDLLNGIDIDYLQDPLRLPYETGAFGAVLSVGVLEHVGAENVDTSLKEISRVLQSKGRIFIFMLPNRFSWVEFIANMRGVSVHPDKYTFSRIEGILARHSFVVEKKWRRNVLPRNLTGLPRSVKRVYGNYYRQIESADTVLSKIVGISLLSGVIELIARKE